MLIAAGRGPLIAEKTVAFQELASTAFENTTLADPIDNTITLEAGSGRVLIDFLQNSNPGAATDTLDPAGDAIALSAVTGSPQAFLSTQENLSCFSLLEASYPGTGGSKTLRYDPTNTVRGHRRVIQLAGASQTIYTAGNNHDAATALTVSVTRPSGNFPAGSRVYAAMNAEDTSARTYTVSGDAAEVQEAYAANGDAYVFAAGTLGSAQATASVTFTEDVAPSTLRRQAIIVVVEPAS